MKKVEIENKRTLFKDVFTITETNLRFEQFKGSMNTILDAKTLIAVQWLKNRLQG